MIMIMIMVVFIHNMPVRFDHDQIQLKPDACRKHTQVPFQYVVLAQLDGRLRVGLVVWVANGLSTGGTVACRGQRVCEGWHTHGAEIEIKYPTGANTIASPWKMTLRVQAKRTQWRAS